MNLSYFLRQTLSFLVSTFVDPVTGEHTNGIESAWMRMKKKIPRRVKDEDWMVLYLNEFLLRENLKNEGKTELQQIVKILEILTM